MSDRPDFVYEDKPIEQSGINRCCICPSDIRRHVKKRVTGKYKTDYVDKEMFWCTRCGLTLTNHDMDIVEAKLRGEIV